MSNLMTVGGNYLGGVAPAAGDDVRFDPASPIKGPNFSQPVANAGLANLASIQMLSGYGGVLKVSTNLTATILNLTATVANTQEITIDNAVTLTSHTVTMSAPTARATIDGAGTFAITGAAGNAGSFNLYGPAATLGVTNLTIDTNSTLTDYVSTLTLDGTNLTNNGQFNWVNGNIATGAASTVTNKGTMVVSGGDHTYAAGADFTNNGVLSIALNASTNNLNFDSNFTEFSAPPLGAPIANVLTGNFRLNGTDSVSAGMYVGPSAVLYITGTYTANAGASITGFGRVEVDTGGSIATPAGVNLVVNPLMMLFATGDLTGPGTFQLNGGLFSTNGSIIGGTTVTASSVNLNNAGGVALTTTGSTLQIGGGTWTSGDIVMNTGSSLINTGAFTITSAGNTLSMIPADTSTFQNTALGTVNFVGAGQTIILTYFVSSGTVNIAGQTIQMRKGLNQTGGTVNLNGGKLDFLNNVGIQYTLSGGLLNANGTIQGGNLDVQGGTLELSGVLALTGNLVLNAGGTLQVDIGDPTQPGDVWGSVNVTGTATLGGTLTVKLKNGLPPAQSRAIITTTGGVAGNFGPPPAGWQINKVNNNKTVELQKL